MRGRERAVCVSLCVSVANTCKEALRRVLRWEQKKGMSPTCPCKKKCRTFYSSAFFDISVLSGLKFTYLAGAVESFFKRYSASTMSI
jgi:hypothetical protein